MNARAKVAPPQPIVRSAEERIGGYDWQALSTELSSYGCAVIDKLLTPDECREIAALYPHEEHFRSHIHMARHASAGANIAISSIPCPTFSPACAPRSIRIWRLSPTRGTSAWGSISAIRASTRIS
jgi:hypothetical protein